MYQAIALLLAYAASDWRHKKEQRSQASRRLQEMPDHTPTVGLSASYGEECIGFLRLLDVGGHDPAKTWRQVNEFLARMRVLFVEGFIFNETPAGVAPEAKTCLDIVLEQARLAPPIWFDGDKVVHLWRKPSPEHAKRTTDGVQAVVEAMSERVRVEASEMDLGILLTAFDLVRWHRTSLGVGGPLVAQLSEVHLSEEYALFKEGIPSIT